MIDVIDSVFKKQGEIKKITAWYQENHKTNHSENYRKLYDFFDSFTDDEIMVLQSIMYFGRECKTNDVYVISDSKVGAMTIWFNNLFFSLGKEIDRSIEISQMVGKAQLIGTYFELGFSELSKLS